MNEVPTRILLDLEHYLGRIQQAIQTWEAYLPWQGEEQAKQEVERIATIPELRCCFDWLERFFASCEVHGLDPIAAARSQGIVLRPLTHYTDRLAGYLQ